MRTAFVLIGVGAVLQSRLVMLSGALIILVGWVPDVLVTRGDRDYLVLSFSLVVLLVSLAVSVRYIGRLSDDAKDR